MSTVNQSATTIENRAFQLLRTVFVIAPIAFVSEHSETLVELDIEYGHLAQASGAPSYRRVPTVSTHPDFIAGLAALVCGALARGPGIASANGARHCPAGYGGCALGHS